METDTARGVEARAAPISEVLDGLNDLLRLDHDALSAYDIAIEKLDDRDHADQIAGFKRDHERHIRELNDLIVELGGSPVNEPHGTGPFKQALQSLGGLAGDRGVLIAWRANELQVRTKYDNYASRAVFWPDNVKRVIDRNALDEERHYHWVADVLQRMGVGAGEGAETDAASRLRERMSTAGDRARAAAESAQARVAGGLETAARKLDQAADWQAATSGPKARAGEAAHRLANGLGSTAEYLRRADGDTLQHDLEARVREHPLQSLLILFAAGFVLGRILR